MLYVDGVSSIASMDFRMDEWGVDLAVSGSQKGFMLATGMAIVGVSPKAMEASQNGHLPALLLRFSVTWSRSRMPSGGYPYTPPVHFDDRPAREPARCCWGRPGQRFARHTRIAEGVRACRQRLGAALCARSPELYSDTVSAIYVPEGFDSNVLTNPCL